MTNLKTLEDLNTKLIYNGMETPHPYEVIENFKKILKAESVKWVKDIRKRAEKLDNSLNRPTMLSVQGWIMKFFNLTERDLK